MSRRFPSQVLRNVIALWLLCAAFAAVARAQSPVTQHKQAPPIGHDNALPSQCANCHKDPHHNQFPGRPCAECHTTDKWVPSTVDAVRHALFGCPLVGAHTPADCAGCHKSGRYAHLPTACGTCHKDVHQGRLGADCARCHFEDAWRDTNPFDHARETGLPLTLAHDKLACAACHGPNGRALDSKQPVTCATCHPTNTAHGHGATFGAHCTQCHKATRFSDVTPFDHRATHFPLERRHSVVPCADCHTPKRAIVTPDCRACHGDPHRGRTLMDCGQCHRADSWLVIRFDHDRTEFPLNGYHFETPCRECHTADVWTGLPRECIFCHRGDLMAANTKYSLHRTYSLACAPTCHNALTWTPLRPP